MRYLKSFESQTDIPYSQLDWTQSYLQNLFLAKELVIFYIIQKKMNSIKTARVFTESGDIETYWFTKPIGGGNLVMFTSEIQSTGKTTLYIDESFLNKLRNEVNQSFPIDKTKSYFNSIIDCLIWLYSIKPTHLKKTILKRADNPAKQVGDYYTSEFDKHFGKTNPAAWSTKLRERSLNRRVVNYLDEGNVGTKLDFLVWDGFLKKKIKDGETLYAMKDTNDYYPGDRFRGQYSDSFKRLKQTGIIEVKKINNRYIILKGPAFEAFKKGQASLKA